MGKRDNMKYLEVEKNLENYIECLQKNVKSFQGLKKIQQNGLQKGKIECNVPIELLNYYINVWKLEALEVVLEDLQEIEKDRKEEERARDNSQESFWKEY